MLTQADQQACAALAAVRAFCRRGARPRPNLWTETSLGFCRRAAQLRLRDSAEGAACVRWALSQRLVERIDEATFAEWIDVHADGYHVSVALIPELLRGRS